MTKLSKKIVDIIVILSCIYLIILSLIKYFVSHQISLGYLFLAELVLGISLLVSFFSFFDQISSLKNFLNRTNRKAGDIFLHIWGIIVGLAMLYMALFWDLDAIARRIFLFGSFFFLLGGIYLLISSRK
jgi:hypothetical protein